MFLHLSVILFTRRGSALGGMGSALREMGSAFGERGSALRGRSPCRLPKKEDTAPPQKAGTQKKADPLRRRPPPEYSQPGNTVNTRSVHIKVECILVIPAEIVDPLVVKCICLK